MLLALAAGPQYGYGIQKQIIGDTAGMYVKTSTVYAAINALLHDGLIEEASGGRYRKSYRITDKGKRKLELESRTLGRAAQLAQQRLGYR